VPFATPFLPRAAAGRGNLSAMNGIVGRNAPAGRLHPGDLAVGRAIRNGAKRWGCEFAGEPECWSTWPAYGFLVAGDAS